MKAPLWMLLVATLPATALPATAQAMDLSTEDIYRRLPLCAFPSSLGPLCRYWSKEKSEQLVPAKLDDTTEVSLTNTTLHIKTSDWSYKYRLTKINDTTYVLEFEDDGLIGTYYSVTNFRIEWSPAHKDWVLTGSTPAYFSGVSEDHRLDIYQPFDPPISLLQ